MSIIAVAGMPGSGKTKIMEQYAEKGYIRFDDINTDWPKNTVEVKRLKTQGKNIIASDILFCYSDWRAKLVHDAGGVEEWIYFANDPYQCSLNVIARAQEKHRNWLSELQWITKLSPVYAAPDTSIPIFVKASLTKSSLHS
jgi:hypothetical protein